MISMTAFHTNPLFARLESAERILVAGAGGGFDIYAGLPVALSLLHQARTSGSPICRSARSKDSRSMRGRHRTSP
jgi:hypothetical protein